MECHPEPPVFSVCLFKNCMLGTYFCTRCWVGERPQWSCIPNLLCHFNKLLSQSCDHSSVLWGIRCFEEERKRFNVLPWQFVPVSFSATCDKGIQAVEQLQALSLFCSVHEHCTQKLLVWLSHSLLFHLSCLPSFFCFWGWCWWIGKGNTELKSNMRQYCSRDIWNLSGLVLYTSALERNCKVK